MAIAVIERLGLCTHKLPRDFVFEPSLIGARVRQKISHLGFCIVELKASLKDDSSQILEHDFKVDTSV